MTERWLPAPGWEEAYEVSDMGRVRSIERVVEIPASATRGPHRRHYKAVILKPIKAKQGSGFWVVNLSYEGSRGVECIHRLVAGAFLKDQCPSPEAQVVHLDGNRCRNIVDNLAWKDTVL